MKVLVTGATGFVGRSLVRRLAADGRFSVRAAVRRGGSADPGVEFVAVDLNSPGTWPAAVRGIDAVVHLAARVHVMRDSRTHALEEFRRLNAAATRHLAECAAAEGVRRLVFVSSVKVHGESGHFDETAVPAPADPYGASKWEAERALLDIAGRTGLEIVVVRPPLVYGPGVGANFDALVQTVRRGMPLPLASVSNQRSLVALGNLTDFLVTCLVHPAAAGEAFLVSDGVDVTTPDLVRRIARAFHRPARLLPCPPAVLRLLGTLSGRRETVDRLLGTLTVDCRKASALLGWIPPVSMDAALESMAASESVRS